MTTTYIQNPAAEVAPLGQGLMVLEPKDRKFCALNPTSASIWFRLKEPANLEELADHIIEHFQGVTKEVALEDARKIIEEMSALGIITCTV